MLRYKKTSVRVVRMVNVAIFVVLLIIAVVLAPWLLGVIALAAATYGAYLVGLGIALAIGSALGVVWGIVTMLRRKSTGQEAAPIIGDRAMCRSCQAEISAKLSRCDNCGAAV